MDKSGNIFLLRNEQIHNVKPKINVHQEIRDALLRCVLKEKAIHSRRPMIFISA